MSEQELIWSAVVAWGSAKGIELAKRVSWVPMDASTETLNRWVARAVAFLAALGLHASFDATAGVLTIAGLTWSGIVLSAGEYAKQYILQEIAYKKFVREDVHDGLRELMRDDLS